MNEPPTQAQNGPEEMPPPGGKRPLAAIEGIGEVYTAALRQAGIATTHDLLRMGASRQGRIAVAEQTGISEKLILEWANHADLFRIRGVGEEYSDLLEEGGVDTVPELAQRHPENLFAKLVEVNREKRLVRRLPGQTQVADWIEQAKALPRVITY